MTQTRRQLIRSSIAIALGGSVAGCLGGGGSDQSSNTSTEAGGSTSQPTRKEGSATSTADATTSGPSVSVLAASPEFDGQSMQIGFDGQTAVDRISLQTPQGEQFGTYQPSQYDNSVSFTLIRSSSKQFGYKSYPFGDWTATAHRDGSKIDEQTYELNPSFSVTDVSNNSGFVEITFKNIGTAPVPVTAARIYNPSINPGPEQFGKGYVDGNSITEPGYTISISTRLLGFDDKFPISKNKSVSDYQGKYCTGKSYPVTISHRIFSEIRETTGSLIFGGGPVVAQQGSAACSDYTLNAQSNVSTSNASSNGSKTTSGRTGTATNGTPPITFTTTEEQSPSSSTSTSDRPTAANR